MEWFYTGLVGAGTILVVLAIWLDIYRRRYKPNVGHPSQPALPSTVPIETSHIMLPDDTNNNGNVHGGTILKLIEKAGFIVSCRHCNNRSSNGEEQDAVVKEPLTAIIARLEHMDFHQPVYVGEVVQLQAAVTYTSPNSIEVTVDVWAENITTNQRRHANTAVLWYVAIPVSATKSIAKATIIGNMHKLVQPVPQVQGLSEQELQEGKKRYETQKLSRAAQKDINGSQKRLAICHSPRDAEDHTVLASQSTLASIVLPSDTITGLLTGGSLMKTMDDAAGICAVRHCHSLVVTASIDEINFYEPITNGELVFVTARVVFTSAKSMEIEVTVEAENLVGGCRRVTNTAYFTYVSLGSNYRSKPVPQLRLVSEEERTRFEEGKKRYEARKKARMDKLQKLKETSKS